MWWLVMDEPVEWCVLHRFPRRAAWPGRAWEDAKKSWTGYTPRTRSWCQAWTRCVPVACAASLSCSRAPKNITAQAEEGCVHWACRGGHVGLLRHLVNDLGLVADCKAELDVSVVWLCQGVGSA